MTLFCGYSQIFIETKYYKLKFKFIKQAFILLIGFTGLVAIKFIPLNDAPCLDRPTLIDLNANELHYFLFLVNLDRCNGSFINLDNPFSRTCVSNKKEHINLNVLIR